MELKPQFAEFLTGIRPTASQQEDWKVGSKTLRSRLEADLDLKDIVVATFLQGSVRRSTAIRPLGEKRPDVDIVVVTNLDYNRLTPKEAMDLFEPFLDRYYKGKWRPQGRSFGIELSYVDLDLVITALPIDGSGHRLMEQLYRSQAVLTTNSLEEEGSWRLNRSWAPPSGLLGNAAPLQDAPIDEWKPHPLFLPDRDAGEWGRTHPLAQIQWTAAKNRACNGHYVNLVRAVKWWRQDNADKLPKYPKGYPLEHMIGHVLSEGTSSMATGLVQALERFRDTWYTYDLLNVVPTLTDHGVPEHNVLARLPVEDFKAFYKAVCEAAKAAREALDSTDAKESGQLWRNLLGSKFPLPGPQGGDRSSGGFTAPTQPAKPEKTERFA
ncbi:SMODS domain-containing nucleotidyltransferase [Pseudomonas sivasensis]|uniref:SMODS domain-containing nucleotidyltransferase n=1 Tax=Pseudomonas sivasensis TaxID=1880678 RepID=UPI003BA04924